MASAGNIPSAPDDPPLDLRASDILDNFRDSFLILDRGWRIVYANREACRIHRKPSEGFQGKNYWEEWPAAAGTEVERLLRNAMAEGAGVHFEYRSGADASGVWVEVDAYPLDGFLNVFSRDITARKRNENALRQSEERYRLLVEGARDYAMILMDEGGRVTGWNAGAERILGWTEAEVLGMPGDLIFTHEDRAAEVPTQELGRAASEGKALDLRWHMRKDGSRFYADGILQGLRDDNGQMRGFAKILRDATGRKALEDERERLADANRLLLDSTGDGIYGIDSQGCFTFVNRAASRMLGASPEGLIGRNAHVLIHHTRPDGAPYPETQCPIYRAVHDGEGAHVEDDVFWRTDRVSFPVSYTAAPIFQQGAVQGVVVTFSDISVRKTLERERDRLAERERNIATQLQAALTPALPDRVPGMALTRYYEVALEEAGVGGDFYDVFALGEGRTVLVIGDLSGKGLEAAAQVSIVRNMLRAFLYSLATVTEAVTELNRVLAENGLLTGFATLFVGVYHNPTRRLTYVNCGQEPALLRRAGTGVVEPLAHTGPVLGAIEGSRYVESDVTLAAGDAIAIFTDGLTEVGISRTDMLGAEGVAALLMEPVIGESAQPAEQMAEVLALRVIAGVDRFARSGVRDDMCLLVGVVR